MRLMRTAIVFHDFIPAASPRDRQPKADSFWKNDGSRKIRDTRKGDLGAPPRARDDSGS